MTRFVFVIIFALVAFPGACEAKERLFSAVASGNQESKYIDGIAHVVARGKDSGVVVSYQASDSSKRGWVTIFFANTGPHAVTVSESTITAFLTPDVQLHVYSYAELQKQQERSEMWSGIGAGLAAGAQNMSASNAGHSYQSGTYSSTTNAQAWGSGGYASGSAVTQGNFSGSTYNAGEAYAAREHAREKSDAILAQQRESMQIQRSSLASRALKANTIEPGTQLVGQVQVDLPKKVRGQPSQFAVQIPVGSDNFVVLFQEQL